MKRFCSLRFGELEYRQQDTINLPQGLIGLPELKRWLLLDMDDGFPLKWLQSLDRGDFALPVTDPAYFSLEYTVRVPEPARQTLRSQAEDSIAVLIITTIHPGGVAVTGNLLSPLLIDIDTRRGVQLMLDDESLSMRQEIDYLKFGLAVNSMEAENEDSGVTGLDPEQTETAQEIREKVST